MADPITITIGIISLIFLGIGLFIQSDCSIRQTESLRLLSQHPLPRRSTPRVCPNCEGRAEGEISN